MIALLPDSLDAPKSLAAFERKAKGAGAIVSFTGLVRPEGKNGVVTSLFLQSHSPLTERGIRRAVEQARETWPLSHVDVLHRIGDIAPGDTIVFVATASTHRRAAFESADFLMDYLKTEAYFWKKEITSTGAHWIEPRAEDYKDRMRWTKKPEV